MVQRTPKTWQEIVKERLYLFSIKPLFLWRKCICCENEFRREPGWVSNMNSSQYGMDLSSREGRYRYLCCRCVPTREEANKYFRGH